MKLAKRERYGALALLIALAGLTADKLLLPQTPRSAEAAEDAGSPGSAALAALTLPPSAGPASQGSAGQLDAGPLSVPDVFAWARLVEIAAPRKAELAPTDAAAVAADEFAARHVLWGTVLGPRPRALVDSRTLAEGDILDGFTLKEIAAEQVVFLSDAARVVLRVPSVREKH